MQLLEIKGYSISFWPAFITLLAFLTMCKLGFWQLDRAEQKENELKLFASKTQLQWSDLKADHDLGLSDLHGRKVRLNGYIDSNNYWLVDNKTHQGQVGYSLVVLIKNEESTSVLVDLGWLPAGKYRAQLPQVNLPKSIELEGVLKTDDFNQLILADDIEPGRRVQGYQQIFRQQSDVLPIIIFAKSNSFNNMPQLYNPVVMLPEKHYGYAVQWFLLALSSLVVFVFANNKRQE